MTVEKSACAERAVSLFKEGFNCAQSVLIAMQEYWDVTKPSEPKVASAFGGGIGRRGSLCGALTGGIIAIGVQFGSNKPSAKYREKAYSRALKFFNRFNQELGSVLCRDLIGYDLTNPDELENARASDAFMNKCAPIVQKAVEILVDLH